MRIVFDSNVWIAALVTSGTSADVIQEALRLSEVFISPYILQEVDRILARKLEATREERRRTREWLEAVCQVVDPPPRPHLACRDPEDLPILWLALAIHADLLVTGDRDLLDLKDLQGIRIIPPALYWQASRQRDLR